MSVQAAFDVDVKRLEEIVRKQCGKNIHLSFITKPDSNTWITGNIGDSNKNCVEACLLANADKVSDIVRPAVMALANSL